MERAVRDAGDAALRVVFGTTLDPRVNNRVLAFADAVRRAKRPGVLSVISGYTSVLIEYDPDVLLRDVLDDWLRWLPVEEAARAGRLVEVPVSYGGDLGPDLDDVARRVGSCPEEVVRLHAAPTYRVYATGFAPGFPFAAPLPARLELPRRDSPRERVPPGSVAIAGRQTGIYPLATPGGWHLLGRTPVPLFRPEAPDPVWLRPGDQIRFVPIDRAHYDRLRAEAAGGSHGA